MDTIDTQAATGHADGRGEMTPNTDADAEVWKRVDDVGHAHHIVVWMVIQELEREGVYPINTPATQKRLWRWIGGEYPKKNRVNRSIERLDQHDIIERIEVDEWPGGKHNTTTAEGYEIARQNALKWLRLLDCEDRDDLRDIDPEAEAAADDGEGGDGE